MRCPFYINKSGKLVSRSFHYLDRIVAKAKQEIMDEVDKDIFDMFKSRPDFFDIEYINKKE